LEGEEAKRGKGEVSSLLIVFFDIQARFSDGFDHDFAFGRGHVTTAGLEDVILDFTGTRDPNDTIFALDRHALLVVHVQNLAWMKQ
jgi:hypothetical protein